MTWFDDSSFWIMHHVFFVQNAPELFERRMVSRCMADGLLENFGTRVYFVSAIYVTFLETTVSMRNCHELSHIGLEEFGKLLQLTLRERKDVTDFTIYSFNYCNRCAYTQENSRANNVIYYY